MPSRLDKQETEALRLPAAREARSMQEVARQAIRDYIERTSKRALLDTVLDEGLPRYSEALRGLGHLPARRQHRSFAVAAHSQTTAPIAAPNCCVGAEAAGDDLARHGTGQTWN